MFHTRTCTHCRLPSELPWESLPPPDPSLIKKLKLSISSLTNVDLRPRQSPDTSHNLHWLQTAGGVCWRTRMTSCRLPRTEGYPKCLVRGGELGPRSKQPHLHHAATVPCTQQGGCWPGERLMRNSPRGSPCGREQGSWSGLRCRRGL